MNLLKIIDIQIIIIVTYAEYYLNSQIKNLGGKI